MTKIDIISGFLGAGKTTLINKLIKEAYKGEKLVLIENEFGDIGIDGGFLQEAGINITEMNSGCICCSLVGDFAEALRKVIGQYSPDRVLIEPSGVGKLSDVIAAVKNADLTDVSLNSFAVVVDAGKCKMYMKNFGEFFNDQIESAGCIIFSHTDKVSEEKLREAVELVRTRNDKAHMITTPIFELCAKDILDAVEQKNSIEAELDEMIEHEHHHHHEHEEHCDCHEHHHHHEHDEHCDCHEHHHHDEHDEHCDCHEHHHHHEHDEHCDCHEHHHHHEHEEHCDCHEHHHHHADEVFTSWGRETVRSFKYEELQAILSELENEGKYGFVLRAKGIVPSIDGKWIHFDYVPGEQDIRYGSSAVTGKLCVIGSKINEVEISKLFNVK